MAIAALVSGIILAYQNCEGFQEICQKLWEVIKPLANAIMNGLSKPLTGLWKRQNRQRWLKNYWSSGEEGRRLEVKVKNAKNQRPDPIHP